MCSQVYPDQALLLLVTEALSQRILDSVLYPILPVLNTFQVANSCFPLALDATPLFVLSHT